MAFDVYPMPQTAPLAVAAGATSALIPFTERADPLVNPDMTIRLVMLGDGCDPPPGGTPAPTVFLKAATGDEVEVPVGPLVATVYSTPGMTSPVADVRIEAEANAVYRIDVFVSTPGSTWQIKIRNNDVASARSFTWVVANNDAESRQPWMHAKPATVTLTALTNQEITQALEISNKGTGPLVLSNMAGALGGGFAITSVPAAIQPNDCATLTLSFTSAVPGTSGAITLTLAGNDTTSQVGGTHNRQATLNANTGKVEVGFMLDGSGSMAEAPDGTTVPIAQSRWAKMKVSANQCLDLLGFFFGGKGRFAVGVFPDIIPPVTTNVASAADIQPATDITVTAINNAKNSLDTVVPIGRTPIGKGIERAIGSSAASFGYFESAPDSLNFNRRLVVLMSDGAHNLGPPAPSAFYPGVASPGMSFTDKRARCLTIAYGDPAVSTPYEVDHVLLNMIAAQSGGTFYFSGTDNAGLDLVKVFRNALVAGLSLDPTVDPPVTLTATHHELRREVTILPYDRKVSFVVDWATDGRPVNVMLVTPLCEVITASSVPVGAVYNSHPRYQIFSFDSAFLRNAADPATPRFGAWKLIVSAPGLTSPERVDYEVITESRLRLALTADRARFFAGDAYRIDATLTLDGLPVRNANVVLTMKRPGQSADKVIAGTLVTPAELLKTATKYAGRELTAKGLRIATLLDKGIRFPGFVHPATTPMVDASDTGVYSATITDTATLGRYEFTVVATGETRDGVQFRREQRMHALVEVRPDPRFTLVDVQFTRLLERITAVVRVYPRDRFGNPLIIDPAIDPTFQFTVKGAEPRTPIEHGADGSYERTIEYKADAKPTIRFGIGGVDVVPKLQPAQVAALVYVDEVVKFRKGGEAERGANKHISPRHMLGDVTAKKPGEFLALGDRGSVVVGLKGKVIQAGKEEDITVFTRSGEDLRPFQVEALAGGRGEKWVLLGVSPGVTQSFSLAKAGLKSTAAIRITDDSRRSRNTDTSVSNAPGVNLSGVGVMKAVRK